MKKTILIVDDDLEIMNLIELYLGDEYQVVKYPEGLPALRYIETHQVHLAVLDVMLPDIDGFSLCQKIREQYFFPIIMLTAKIEDFDRINGLMLGADDYMTKPFNPLELVARIKSQLRRMNQYNINAVNEELYLDGLLINKSTHTCSIDDKPLNLTPLEFDILWYLASNAGEVISSEDLFEAVWKEKYLDNNNTVMTHISRIRDKIGEVASYKKIIQTVWGVGYKIEK
ncbi:response regulator transcription factor [Culicoidibacter larvae]|uniref:Response regulator transcription factor n=1 Tax=Culicoidibacter larvae TaxID=2579976 RepID=A0A5R8QEP3_9FIRM|nr:response regulator transcription factor [Culicoidibacter larvae]TLG75412.1 response regulator transcription factor [Culicoidibacter larvae]